MIDKIVAVAVSGGKDSMSVLNYAVSKYEKVYAVIVDHGLRNESGIEANKVKDYLYENCIETIILKWNHNGIKTKIQETARINRYKILINWCKENNIKRMLVGHHLMDQFETFIMRLSKGSGISGLCCMQKTTEINGIIIERPFIDIFDIPKVEFFIDDPSNENTNYERVRYRNILKSLIDCGFSMGGFLKSIKKIEEVDNYLTQQENEFFDKCVIYNNDEIKIDYEILRKTHKVMFERIINRIINKKYPIRRRSIDFLYDQMKFDKWNGSSMANFQICLISNYVVFKKHKNI